MPIDPNAVQWDGPDPAAVQWDDAKDEPAARMHVTKPPSESIDGIPRMFPRQRATAKADSTRNFGEVLTGAGSMLVGGPLAAAGLRAVPGLARFAPGLVNAAQSSGMTTGANLAGATLAQKAADVGVRAAGGALAGGVSAGLVNPEDAGTGAAIGAAMPGVVQFLGKFGSVVGGVFKPRDAKAGAELAKALDLLTPADRAAVIAQLRAAPELVPGSRPTVAQALQTPQAGILERVIGDSAGGAALQNQRVAQNLARLSAIEGVAPTVPNGFRSAQQDIGEAIGRFAQAERGKAKAATRAAYEAVPQDEAALYLPDLVPVRDQFFGRGSFTDRGAVDAAVNTAESMGRQELPAVAGGLRPTSLSEAVRRAGGLSLSESAGRRGELDLLRGDLKNLVRVNGGERLDMMAQRMHEAGYIPDDGVNTLLDALKQDARGGGVFSFYDAPAHEAIPASSAPVKVTLREFDNLRRDIGASQRAAAGDPARAREAAALDQMRRTMDDRLEQVVRGDGAADEVLPIEWANQLDEARKLKRQEVERFLQGPQAAMFKTRDGVPVKQGGEITSLFWGSRPGLADDVRSFRRLIEDNPALLGQFRSMVTTQGAGTITAAGNLSSKFAQWFDTVRPGLDRLFDPEKVRAMERIAQDIKRADAAANAGRGVGSNTYQNAQNALSIGLLDNPIVAAGVGRIPFVGAGVDLLRESATKGKAKRLADVLADSQSAANALMLVQPSGSQAINPLLQTSLRVAPLLGAGR